jgi:hypothetical protein
VLRGGDVLPLTRLEFDLLLFLVGPAPLLTTVHGVGYRLADDAAVVLDPHA